jgi:hypothetical protein
MNDNAIGPIIVGSAVELHRDLGPDWAVKTVDLPVNSLHSNMTYKLILHEPEN